MEDGDDAPACPPTAAPLFNAASALERVLKHRYALVYGHERLADEHTHAGTDVRWPVRVLVANRNDAATAIESLGGQVNCTDRFCRQTCMRLATADADADAAACVPLAAHFPGDGFFPWRFADAALREAHLVEHPDKVRVGQGAPCVARVLAPFHAACAVAYTTCVHHTALSKSAHVLLGALEPLAKFGYKAEHAYDIRRVCHLAASVVRDPHHHDSEPWTLWPPTQPYDDTVQPTMPLAFPLAALVKARHVYDDGRSGGDVVSRAFDLRCATAVRVPLALGGGSVAKNWCIADASSNGTAAAAAAAAPSFAKQAGHGIAERERAVLELLRDATRLGWPHLVANATSDRQRQPPPGGNGAAARGVCGLPPFAEPAGSGGAFTGRGLHSQAFVGDASLEDLAEKLARQARTRFEAYSALRYFLVDLVDALIALRAVGVRHGDLAPAHVRVAFCHVAQDDLPARYRLLSGIPLHWASASSEPAAVPATLRAQPVLVDFGWATVVSAGDLAVHPLGESARLKGLRFGLRPPPNADSDAWMLGAALRDALGAFPPVLPLADALQTLPTPPLSTVRRWLERPPAASAADRGGLEDRCEALCALRLANGDGDGAARDALKPLLLDEVRANRTIARCATPAAAAAALDARSRDLAASGRLAAAAAVALREAAVLHEVYESEASSPMASASATADGRRGAGDSAARGLCRAHNNLGVLYTHLDLPLHAKRHLERALQLDGRCLGAAENLEHVERQHGGVLALLGLYRSAAPDVQASARKRRHVAGDDARVEL